MHLTKGQLFDAVSALQEIINRPRRIPQLTKYRITRMHGAMEKPYLAIEAERINLVKELGSERIDEASGQPLGWQVMPGNMLLYAERWTAIRDQSVEVKVEPIRLSAFGNADEGGIEAHEFKLLGLLVVEDDPMPEVAN